METGKLFIGGISWDTSEERLRDYFQSYGEVVEAVIMKDRTTGRARGFGFVVFANAFVAEKVVGEKHVIDGRTVEAKKAVPRDDHQNFNRISGSTQSSPGPARTKKIFVGGLASTVTESDFKKYFEQFGTITDVVVMYDHNTQRPRGFGFITFDTEEAVDKVLIKTFHELNGKMVEVKRAVPKELSPGSTRSQSSSSIYGANRLSSLLNAYSPGYNSNSACGLGMRMDGRLSPISMGRSGYSPYSPADYNIGLNLDSGFGLNFESSGDSGLSYGRGPSSYFGGNLNRFGSPIGYDVGDSGASLLLNSTKRNVWGSQSLNQNINSLTSNAFSGNGNVGNFGNIGEIWGSSPVSVQARGNGSLSTANIGHGAMENDFNGRTDFIRNNGGTGASYSVAKDIRGGTIGSLFEGESFYSNDGWRSSSSELGGLSPFGFELGAAADIDIAPKNSVGYIGRCSVTGRSNRGIAA